MGLSITTVTSDGITTELAVPFDYAEQDDILVYVEGQVDGGGNQIYLPYTWINDALIDIGTPQPNGTEITIARTTDVDEKLVTFKSGPIPSDDLNQQFDQLLFLIQEIKDGRLEAPLYTDLDAGNNRIINLADPIDPTDAANKSYLDDIQAASEAARDAAIVAQGAAETAQAAAEVAQAAAEASAVAALASENKAHDWAEEDEDVEVDPGEYSAKHYSIKAEAAAAGVTLPPAVAETYLRQKLDLTGYETLTSIQVAADIAPGFASDAIAADAINVTVAFADEVAGLFSTDVIAPAAIAVDTAFADEIGTTMTATGADAVHGDVSDTAYYAAKRVGEVIHTSSTKITATVATTDTADTTAITLNYTPKFANSVLRIRATGYTLNSTFDFGAAETDAGLLSELGILVDSSPYGGIQSRLQGRTKADGNATLRVPAHAQAEYTCLDATQKTITVVISSGTVGHTTQLIASSGKPAFLIVEEIKQ